MRSTTGPMASAQSEPQMRDALREAAATLDSSPQDALDRAEAISLQSGAWPQAELLACTALRRLGRSADAVPRLSALAHSNPGVPAVLWELAQAASEGGESDRAIAALRALTALQPAIATGWFLLARELRRSGQDVEAWRADLTGVQASTRDRGLLEAAAAMNERQLEAAESLLAERLARTPDDPAARRLLGEIRWRAGDMDGALAEVSKAVDLAPGFDLARDFLIRLLLQSNRLTEALDHVEQLARSPARPPAHDLLKASVLVRLGEQERARDIYRALLAQRPDQPQVWHNLGHVLKTLGEQADAVHAYRRAVALQPAMGEAWWSLANLKSVSLSAADITVMETALAALQPEREKRAEDIFHLHFALGKALEDAGEFAESFRQYDHGNRLRRNMVPHDADAFSAEVAQTARVFSAPFIAAMGKGGCLAADPIFVVGLPRSGSTLVEQILASHSQVEGTMELPEMMMIASRLQSRVDEGEFADFASMMGSLAPADRVRLGEEYLDRTQVHRRTDRPRFIDKMPNNWQHVGLIRLILPHASIIDVRRHPMSCCFSGWKQHFARGQTFSYDLTEIGRYYGDYVGLMAAFDAARPGAVHRVFYERLVADTRGEVERMLEYLGLAFEESCLAFHENRRAVRTASSEQVRRPIYTDGLEQWKNYEAWLGPLAASLGPLVEQHAESMDGG